MGVRDREEGRPDGRAAAPADDSLDGAADGDDREDPRQSRAFLDSIVEHIPNMVFVKDAAELRFVRFNRAGEDLIGYTRDDMVGKNDYDLFPQAEADFFTKKDREVLAGRDVVDIPAEPIETRYKGQRILHTQKIPILGPDGEAEFLLGISEDITDRVMAANALRDRQQTLSAVFAASPDAVLVLGPDLAIREVSDSIERIDGIPAAAHTLRGWLDAVHPDDAEAVADALAAMVRPEADTVEVRYRTRHADGHWVPVEARGRSMSNADGTASGAVVVVRDISERLAAEEQLLAERETVAILQRALLPKLPSFSDVQVAGTYRPAGDGAVVGGDWYDAFALDDETVGLVIGDVAGHGIAAGALMAQLRNAARTLAAVGRTPSETLTELNDVMRRFEPHSIATAIVAFLHTPSRRLTWSVAGHPPLAVWDGTAGVRAGGAVDGPPLGAVGGVVYSERVEWVAEDALVVLYTDGLIERRDETLSAGLERLVQVVGDIADTPELEQLCTALCERLVPHGPQSDDVCVLAVRCGSA